MIGRHMWLVCGVAVQQDHRAALAADEIVQPHAVDLGEALGEAARALSCAEHGPSARYRQARRGSEPRGSGLTFTHCRNVRPDPA